MSPGNRATRTRPGSKPNWEDREVQAGKEALALSERFRKLCEGCIVAVMAAVFILGLALYPDNPIHPCDGPGGYCGKQGQPHTVANYNGFRLWERTILIVWPLGFLGFGLLQIGRPKK